MGCYVVPVPRLTAVYSPSLSSITNPASITFWNFIVRLCDFKDSNFLSTSETTLSCLGMMSVPCDGQLSMKSPLSDGWTGWIDSLLSALRGEIRPLLDGTGLLRADVSWCRASRAASSLACFFLVASAVGNSWPSSRHLKAKLQHGKIKINSLGKPEPMNIAKIFSIKRHTDGCLSIISTWASWRENSILSESRCTY